MGSRAAVGRVGQSGSMGVSVAERAVWADGVVVLAPFLDGPAGVAQAGEPALVEALVAQPPHAHSSPTGGAGARAVWPFGDEGSASCSSSRPSRCPRGAVRGATRAPFSRARG